MIIYCLQRCHLIPHSHVKCFETVTWDLHFAHLDYSPHSKDWNVISVQNINQLHLFYLFCIFSIFLRATEWSSAFFWAFWTHLLRGSCRWATPPWHSSLCFAPRQGNLADCESIQGLRDQHKMFTYSAHISMCTRVDSHVFHSFS